ncbi:PEP-CTERM sorting domain-containing protein [Pacificoceanicola onchidii]|uniref:PEP-CTERM sorting domain-containing protein n=1 Tax=Pacificoceanicola onchidii TaxID=2562685 RepID=UPI0010A5732B|nr:PEP-CTERM sorting domain-containing protein [Pacificoceanicola onchidii]
MLRLRLSSLLLLCLLAAGFAANPMAAKAATMILLIGDDDGFGGTQGVMATPGQPYSNAAAAGLGVIAAGTYSNEAALDVNSVSPATNYTFHFTFAYNMTGLGPLTSAIVGVQHGSLGLRSSGAPGFGAAAVTGDAGGGPLGLGSFLASSTGPAGSPLEESVKLSSFDVTALLSGTTSGVLTLTIDGSGIASDPVDLFAMDFARLTIETAAVPLPATLPLLLLAAGGLGLARQRRRD